MAKKEPIINKDYNLEYWIEKAKADKELPIGVQYEAGYLDWLTWCGTGDMKRPISTLIKKAIKVEKENKMLLKNLKGKKFKEVKS